MADAERRIIGSLATSGATRPAELPGRLLDLLEDDHQEGPSHAGGQMVGERWWVAA